MKPHIKKYHDFYNLVPNAGIIQTEFGFYCFDRWKKEGYINDDTDTGKLFGFEWIGKHCLGELGWCEAPLLPEFKVEVLEDRGEHELVRDFAGRSVLYFKGKRDGFMPEYVDHPVKDMKTFEENIKWRLDPNSPERYKDLETRMKLAMERQNDDECPICQSVIGGYMYLRSLIGPEDLLYKFYDSPELIHACMQAWFDISDRVISEHQKYVSLDELFLAEDICYKSGPLISPDMMREFLFPYYQQLINNIKKRQLSDRKLHIQIDTDGNALPVIDVYKEIGMDFMSPFEVASDCDVVEIRKKYPDLLMLGGFDKRILAQGKDAIDREVDRIMPFMKEKGGYIPTCDHGVPEEVNFEDYMHYRKRMAEYK